jgi:NADH-quinone oxidoreductase subunit C
MELTNNFVLEAISREFPESVLGTTETYGMLSIEIKNGDLKKIVHHMKDSTLGFTFLTDLCGIHHPEIPEKELGVIYHLHNLVENRRIRLKTFMPKENAEVDTLTDLFAAANWMERETFDFYGIRFKGHPDLRVILNDPEMGYHPMLKGYPLEDGTRLDKDDTMFGR